MATAVKDCYQPQMTRSKEGHREYKITYLVVSTDLNDGPGVVLLTTGLPRPGDPWVFGNDFDDWAYCTLNADVQPVEKKEGSLWWEVTFTFSTEVNAQRCKDQQIDDPLQVADRISGGFIHEKEEATHDRFGNPVRNSAWEQIRGPHVEFDRCRPTVKVVQNRLFLEYPLCASMVDHVNGVALWGLPPRCIRLANFSWEFKTYGACYSYFEHTFEFEADFNTFDRVILDEGTKVLNGHWDQYTASRNRWILDPVDQFGNDPDPTNPQDFCRFQDKQGNLARVLLDGKGQPASATTVTGSYVSIQGGNLNHAVTDTTWWKPLAGGNEPAQWDPAAAYVAGNLTTFQGFVYLSKTGNTNVEPDLSAADWLWLVNGVELTGNWSASETYAAGAIAFGLATSAPGRLYLQKYGEADFLLLGIPAFF